MPKEFVEKRIQSVIFNRNNFRRGIYFALAMVAINIFLILKMYYVAFTIEQPVSFATTTDGRVIKLIED